MMVVVADAKSSTRDLMISLLSAAMVRAYARNTDGMKMTCAA